MGGGSCLLVEGVSPGLNDTEPSHQVFYGMVAFERFSDGVTSRFLSSVFLCADCIWKISRLRLDFSRREGGAIEMLVLGDTPGRLTLWSILEVIHHWVR